MFDNLKKPPKEWQKLFIILWISFLLAIMATGLVFSVIDPVILSNSIQFMNQSSVAIYSMGFLLFWILSVVSAYISYLFIKTYDA